MRSSPEPVVTIAARIVSCRLPSASLDQGDTEVGRVLEVPVERGRRHADGPGDLAQPEAAQALVLQELERRVHEGLPGLLLLGLPDSESVAHTTQ